MLSCSAAECHMCQVSPLSRLPPQDRACECFSLASQPALTLQESARGHGWAVPAPTGALQSLVSEALETVPRVHSGGFPSSWTAMLLSRSALSQGSRAPSAGTRALPPYDSLLHRTLLQASQPPKLPFPIPHLRKYRVHSGSPSCPATWATTMLTELTALLSGQSARPVGQCLRILISGIWSSFLFITGKLLFGQ